MGAEMLIQSIGFKAKDRHLIDEEWARSALTRAREAIDAIDETRLVEINEPFNTYTTVENCKQTLLSDLVEVQAAVFETRRQALTIDGGHGIILLLSGGRSWGDAPTEMFERMARLLEADVFPDARWEEA